MSQFSSSSPLPFQSWTTEIWGKKWWFSCWTQECVNVNICRYYLQLKFNPVKEAHTCPKRGAEYCRDYLGACWKEIFLESLLCGLLIPHGFLVQPQNKDVPLDGSPVEESFQLGIGKTPTSLKKAFLEKREPCKVVLEGPGQAKSVLYTWGLKSWGFPFP